MLKDDIFVQIPVFSQSEKMNIPIHCSVES